MKTIRKTVKEWVETLPEPYCSAVMSNLLRYREISYLNHIKCGLPDVLSGGFAWVDTIEGQPFWTSLHDSIVDGKDLPPYPLFIEDLCSILEGIE